MGLGSNARQRTTFLKRIDKIVRALGACPVFDEPYRYRMNSRAGNWEFHFNVYSGDMFSRFEHPDLARAIPTISGVNEYSGKWNCHWGQRVTVQQAIDAVVNRILNVCTIKPRRDA